MFELIAQNGQDLVQIVSEAGAAVKVYKFGKQVLDRLEGFIGDKQEENAAKLSENTAAKLKGIAEDRLSTPSPSVLTPLLEGAIQKSRKELQDLWAALLANSMIDGGKKVRRDYLDVVRRLELLDVIVLNIIRLPLPATANANHPNAWQNFREETRNAIGLGLDEWLVSVKKLVELGCAHQNFGQEPHTTPFARMFLAACEVR